MFKDLSTSCVTTPRLPQTQCGMAEMHESMRRLYAAAADLTPPIKGQSDLARAIDETPQTVNNWESRGISQRAANKAQRILGISATWLLSGSGPKLVGEPVSRPSQSAQPDFEMMGSAVYLLREYLEIVGDPPEWVADPVMLEIAWWVVEGFGEQVTPNNVIDLTKRLGNRIRGAKGKEGDERSDTEGGAAAGAARRRTA